MNNKEKKFDTISTEAKIQRLAGWLADKQGADILGLDVRGISAAAEAMLIVSGRGARHCQALADHLLQEAKGDKIEFLGMEGYKPAEWILMDFNDVVAHIFQRDSRDFFNLEGLWAEAPVLCRLEESADADDFDDEDENQ